MRRHRTRSRTRFALALAVVAGLVWAAPAQAGSAAPVPTVTITPSPGPLGVSVPTRLKASWEIHEPGRAATLWIEGETLTATTLVAVWTSRAHVIPQNSDIGGISSSWEVSQVPVGSQSRQEMSGRVTRVRGGWDAWRTDVIKDPYVTSLGVHVKYWVYRGARLPHGQTQHRLVLRLEPLTTVQQRWNVGY